jgi:capsular exopolysaccharide synthesis family protein
MARTGTGVIDPFGTSSQPLRALRVSVEMAATRRPKTSLLFTSADDREGKTTVAINHALVAAASGQSTLIIDANLDRSDVHNRLGLPLTPGLVDYVVGDAPYDELVRTATVDSVQVDVLRAAGEVSSSGDILASREMAELISSASDSFDLVIIDAPSVLTHPDANVLSALPEVDTVLVVRRGQQRKRLKQAIAQLERTQANLLGLVLNEG